MTQLQLGILVGAIALLISWTFLMTQHTTGIEWMPVAIGSALGSLVKTDTGKKDP